MRALPLPIPALLLSLPLLGLAACGTPEYRAERSICEAEWMQRIPPRYEKQMVERTRYEQRPTGQSTCTTTGGVTNCIAQMTTIDIPYVAVETVDVNSSRRNVQIEACAAKACQQKIGNAECESPGG